MGNETSKLEFYLIDSEGNKRVPRKVQTRHGPFGYAIHPPGKGNDVRAAQYTEDLRDVVEAVVLHGRGVRARVVGGKSAGQLNTVSLGGSSIRGYWLSPELRTWVAGARIRPTESSKENGNP
jgi:hypothetical protein